MLKMLSTVFTYKIFCLTLKTENTASSIALQQGNGVNAISLNEQTPHNT